MCCSCVLGALTHRADRVHSMKSRGGKQGKKEHIEPTKRYITLVIHVRLMLLGGVREKPAQHDDASPVDCL